MRTGTRRQALAVLGLAALSLAGAEALTPRIKLAEQRARKIDLETLVPTRFGNWRMDERLVGAVINPVEEENVRRLYSQTLARSYADAQGHRVLLSIAYGEDQRKYLALHYPEVCYPAQGFAVQSNEDGWLRLPGGPLAVRRLRTQFGAGHLEPLTYWATLGDFHSFGGTQRRLLELRYGLDRLIPDGLLFRVSSQGPDTETQFQRQEAFIRELLAAMPASDRELLTGRSPP